MKLFKPQFNSKFQRYLLTYLNPLEKSYVGYWGNFGHGDLGDDAAFYEVQKRLDAKTKPLSKKCYAFYPSKLKMLLVGGGGAFRWESPYLPRRLLLADTCSYPVVVFGAGVNCDYGYEYTPETIEKIKKVCRLSRLRFVRDNWTKRMLEEWGIREEIEVVPDFELLVEPSKKVSAPQKKKTVGIVLTPHSMFGKEVFKKMAEDFISFSKKLLHKGYNVLYIPFETVQSEDEKEQKVLASLKSFFRDEPSVSILPNQLNFQEVMDEIAEKCDLMICMRMHSAVYAAAANKPYICLSYNEMHDAWAEMVGMEKWQIPYLSGDAFERLEALFCDLEKEQDQVKIQMKEKVTLLREQILKQIQKVKNCIEG